MNEKRLRIFLNLFFEFMHPFCEKRDYAHVREGHPLFKVFSSLPSMMRCVLALIAA